MSNAFWPIFGHPVAGQTLPVHYEQMGAAMAPLAAAANWMVAPLTAPVTLPLMGHHQPSPFAPWMPHPPAFFPPQALGYVRHHPPQPSAGSSMPQAFPHHVPSYHGSVPWPVTSLAPRGNENSIYASNLADGHSLYTSNRSDRPPPPPRPAASTQIAKHSPEFAKPMAAEASNENPVLSSSVGVISSSDMRPSPRDVPRAPSPTNSQGSKRSSKSVRSGTSSARRAQGAMFKPPSQAGSAPASQNSSREPTPRNYEPMAM